jgi:predicted phosphodiesterase
MFFKTYDKRNVLIIGDTHIPYEQEGYLEHCLQIQKDKKCGTVVHIGDLSDQLSLQTREVANPNGLSAKDETLLARDRLQSWYKAFPGVKLCIGNHDLRCARKSQKNGIPEIMMAPFKDVFKVPDGWEIGTEHVIDDVLYTHGFGSGMNAHRELAIYNRMSAVQGHSHAFAGIAYTASQKDCLFGMNVGTGIDRSALAFAYGHSFKVKPIVSCAIVENGKNPQIFKMIL